MTRSSLITRRGALAGSLAMSASGALTRIPKLQERTLLLWYRQPAAAWTEALPIGNGRLGAMVFGRVAQERLQLNHDTLWAGSPYSADNPDGRAALAEVRRLVAAGRYKDAEQLASAHVMGKPLVQMPYGTLGDLLLTFPAGQRPADYRRELDLETALAGVAFRSGSGEVRREIFASALDQLIVVRIEGERGGADFDLTYRGPRKALYPAEEYGGAKQAPAPPLPTDWLMHEPEAPQTAGVTIAADGPNALLITGANEPSSGVPAGLTFAVRVEAASDGRVQASGDGLRVRGAKTVTLRIAAATSYRSFQDVGADPVATARAACGAAAGRSYAELRARHVADYRALFGTLSIDLGQGGGPRLPTDVRVKQAESADDPALAALYLQYARYLMIACSRPGGQAANLQGLWNEGTNPPWGGKYTININTEMNYWPAGPTGLRSCTEPLLRLVEDLAVTGARTAQLLYGARGWVAHHNSDLWRSTAPDDGPLWGLWPCGGAWLCNTLWTDWQYARDPAVLARLYPLLKGAALFFVDTLVEDPQGRGLITAASSSPEHQHPFGSTMCDGPAMDRQIIRDLFAHTIEAGALLGRDAEWRAQLGETRARIAPDRIGAAGQLQEWLEDWDEQAPDPHHRHVSHLYAVYPSDQINIRDTPHLIDAAKTSLRQRGDLSTGWATAWRICLWARMGEGDHAHDVLKGLLGPLRTYPNLFDAHPPFQIDGNFGGAGGIMEMLVQSWGNELRLLPALPAAWPTGSIRGARARGGLKVDLSWRHGKPTTLRIEGRPLSVVKVRAGGEAFEAGISRRGVYRRSWGGGA